MPERAERERPERPSEREIGSARTTGTARVKRGLAEMLRGGVIMDVVDADQAKVRVFCE